MGTFSWTEYYFMPSGEPLSPEAYAAVHASTPPERDGIVDRVRAAQKAAFRKDHNAEFIMLYIFLAGIPLLVIPPVGGIILFLLFIPCMSLWNSSYSHNKALNSRCNYLRSELVFAVHASSYSEYLRTRSNARNA